MKFLETTECIEINNHGKVYTDCMEFSLLRFIQMIFSSEKEINSEGLSNYYTDVNHDLIEVHPDLKSYIERFPKIYKDSNYYLEGEGAREREEWAKFVSDRSYFEYYRPDGAELFTNLYNIIIICKELLGMKLDLEDSEPDNIRIISKNISEYRGSKFQMYIGYKEKDTLDLPVAKILSFVSKPQPDFETLDKPKYSVISKRTILHLIIENTNDDKLSSKEDNILLSGSSLELPKKAKESNYVYNWNLYEVYFKNDKVVSNKFITGHSVIM